MKREHIVTNPSDLIVDYWTGNTMYNEQNQLAGSNVTDLYNVVSQREKELHRKKQQFLGQNAIVRIIQVPKSAEIIRLPEPPSDESGSDHATGQTLATVIPLRKH